VIELHSESDKLTFNVCFLAAVDFFNQINMLYGTITEFCTPQECPVMSAGPKYEYMWADGRAVKKAINCSAPDYVDFLMTWVQVRFLLRLISQFSNRQTIRNNWTTNLSFLRKLESPFPETLSAQCKTFLSGSFVCMRISTILIFLRL